VAGGRGGFFAEILKAHPIVRGVLYDHPEVVKEPTAVMAAGLMDRCEVVGGNFLESVPGGADAYIAKRILMDWDDEHVVALLCRCRRAMAEHGRVITVNVVMPPGNQPHPGKIIDLFLIVQLRGRERTEQEFRELYRRAGLGLTKIVPTPSMLSLAEGERAESGSQGGRPPQPPPPSLRVRTRRFRSDSEARSTGREARPGPAFPSATDWSSRSAARGSGTNATGLCGSARCGSRSYAPSPTYSDLQVGATR
jgi:O-methyltransferase domain